MEIMNWFMVPYISSHIFCLNKVVWPHQKFKGEEKVQVYHVSGRRRTGSVCERPYDCHSPHILFIFCAPGRQPQIPIHQDHQAHSS